MKNLLDSLHEKILKSKFAEEVTEAEIDALVKAKQGLNENKQDLTNGDKIRNMTDEELAVLLFEQTNCDYCNIRTKCRHSNTDDCKGVF